MLSGTHGQPIFRTYGGLFSEVVPSDSSDSFTALHRVPRRFCKEATMLVSQQFALQALSRLAGQSIISTVEEESTRGLIANHSYNGMVDTSILPERLRRNLEQPLPFPSRN